MISINGIYCPSMISIDGTPSTLVLQQLVVVTHYSAKGAPLRQEEIWEDVPHVSESGR